jgi:hypothetical protein
VDVRKAINQPVALWRSGMHNNTLEGGRPPHTLLQMACVQITERGWGSSLNFMLNSYDRRQKRGNHIAGAYMIHVCRRLQNVMGPTSSLIGRESMARRIRFCFMQSAATRWMAGGLSAMPRLNMLVGSLPPCTVQPPETRWPGTMCC